MVTPGRPRHIHTRRRRDKGRNFLSISLCHVTFRRKNSVSMPGKKVEGRLRQQWGRLLAGSSFVCSCEEIWRYEFGILMRHMVTWYEAATPLDEKSEETRRKINPCQVCVFLPAYYGCGRRLSGSVELKRPTLPSGIRSYEIKESRHQ